MAKKKPPTNHVSSQLLRERAEELLRTNQPDISEMPIEDIQALVHELQVHQIELELQNEQLRQAQIELADSRDRYADLYDFAPVGYLTLDMKGRIIDANLTAAAMLDVGRKDLVSAALSRFVARDSQDDCYLHLQAVFAGDTKQVCQLAMHKNDGTPMVVRLESISQQASATQKPRCRTALIDMTDVHTARQELYRLNDELEQRVAARTADLRARTDQLAQQSIELEQSEQRLRAILNTAWDAIITINRSGIIQTANPSTERMFGYRSDELIGQNIKMLMPPPYHDEHDDYVARYLETGQARMIDIGREVVGKRKDDSTFPIDLTVSEVEHMHLFTGIIRDITERKKAEEALRREHQFRKSLINTARNIILVLDPTGRILLLNSYMEELTGWRFNEVQGCDWFETFLPKHDRQEMKRLFERALHGQRSRGTVHSILTKDGRERQIRWYDAPLTDANRKLMGLLYTGQDITDQLQLLKEILDISAQEQRRIGQELHDDVGQQLTGLSLLAQTLQDTLAKTDWPEAKLASRLSETLKQAGSSVRLLSRGLNPVEVDAQGLMSALNELTSRHNQIHGISCTFECPQPVQLSENQIATHLYRIAQEAISNAVRHGEASHIHVSLVVEGEQLQMTVHDDGIGFQPNKTGTTGVGLRTMRYRAELIGATLEIGPAETGGTVVRCIMADYGHLESRL